MRFILRQIFGLVIAAVIVIAAWTWTPESEFKDRIRARDPFGAIESLSPRHWL